MNGITIADVNDIIRRMLDINEGKLRFFFGRKSPDMARHNLLRYFYFLPGKPAEYKMKLAGEWMPFADLMQVYNNTPANISRILLADLSRMTTIVLTQKIFDENGVRRIKAKSYKPTYDLVEVQEKEYDFQDDKWIRVSMFNSDAKGFYLRRWVRNIGRKQSHDKWEANQ